MATFNMGEEGGKCMMKKKNIKQNPLAIKIWLLSNHINRSLFMFPSVTQASPVSQ